MMMIMAACPPGCSCCMRRTFAAFVCMRLKCARLRMRRSEFESSFLSSPRKPRPTVTSSKQLLGTFEAGPAEAPWKDFPRLLNRTRRHPLMLASLAHVQEQ